MNYTEYGTKNEYYASSNGYKGFNSYFNSVFDSSNFKKVFVLKGGPGTGKSTFLKKICSFSCSQGFEIEIFRCSSDPKSLDGVIIKSGNLRVAILDGTAPHERDAVIPGAIDEIINLGVAWNSESLEKQRESILKYHNLKSSAYKETYRYLSHSSIFATNIEAEIKADFDFGAASKACEKITKSFLSSKGTNEIRLISSFSKDGYTTLRTPYFACDKIYSVCGKYTSASLFLTVLADKFSYEKVPFCKIVSPFDPSILEGIFLDEKKTAILAMGEGEEICDSTVFLKSADIDGKYNDLSTLDFYKNDYLSRAQSSLKKASEYHFKLEEIYSPAMDFDILDKLSNNIVEKIKKIFHTAS